MTGTAQTPPEPSWPRFTCEIEQDGDTRVVRWQDADGRLQDPPDGTPAVRHLNLGIPAHEDHDVIAQCVREDELPGDAAFDDIYSDADGTVWDTYRSADGRWWATLAEEDTDIELAPSWPGLTREAKQDGDTRIVRWQDADGRLQDPLDGTAAVRWFYPDGTVELEAHYQAERIQDPPDGTPAVRWLYPDGRVKAEGHYQAGTPHDPPDGTPAVREYHPHGTVRREEHYQGGNLQDPLDGTPAVRRFYLDGSVEVEGHYKGGHLQDPPDGAPAVRVLHPDGTVRGESHWQAGEVQDD